MTTPIFTCSVCGAQHTSTEQDNAPGVTPEEAAKLRGSWEAACARISRATTREERTRLEASEVRASIVYFGAVRRTDVWKVPEALVSYRRADQTWQLRCVSCT